MSGIYISCMEMPENCQECFCLNDEYFFCQAVGRKPKDENILQRRPDWCPIIFVPDHGRLVDGDELKYRMLLYYDFSWQLSEEISDFFCNTPTVIQADMPDDCMVTETKHCPYCGEAMSEIREHNGKQYRHCYGCHFEFAEGGE